MILAVLSCLGLSVLGQIATQMIQAAAVTLIFAKCSSLFDTNHLLLLAMFCSYKA